MGVAHSLDYRVGVQDLRLFTVDFWVYAQLRGEVNFLFPGPHVSSCSCAVFFVHGVRYRVGVRFIVIRVGVRFIVISGRLF